MGADIVMTCHECDTPIDGPVCIECNPGALKPCPFCGGDARRLDFELPQTPEDDPNFGGSCIECTKCHCCTAVEFDRREHLYSRWNERVRSSQPVNT